MQAILNGCGILTGEFELVGRIELRLQLDRLDGWSAQAEYIDADSVLPAGRGLDLEAAGQGIRIVLKRDNGLDRGVVGSHRDYAASDEAGGIGDRKSTRLNS